MFELKSLKNYNIIPTNLYYSSDEWYTYIKDNIQKITINFFGKRELIVDCDLIYENLDKIKNNTFVGEILVPYVSDMIDTLFISNKRKYERIFNALVTSNFNPLWNVDGTEVREYEKNNTGSQENINVKSGNITDNVAYNGTENNTSTKSGSVSDTVDYRGSETNVESGNKKLSNTSFDSDTFLDATNETYNNITNEKTFNSRNDSNLTTYNNLRDEQIKTFTNRSDNRTETYNNVKDDSNRTDNLKEEYSETITRSGNIGVTKSSELIKDAVMLYSELDFINLIAKDIVNMICYMC